MMHNKSGEIFEKFSFSILPSFPLSTFGDSCSLNYFKKFLRRGNLLKDIEFSQLRLKIVKKSAG